ncbi:hypothetical protein [Halocalculus aciditolerans]|uniref:Uncharacterized protein n=1 Tax=Halocalculus aciditolerans TaxID=1383812 RepID=A0A830F1E4_9EURY|nr:hypothetical protein [Halocalculus aciditolerans]GGL52024.1 hypothetical protein GCM10009039_07880 [Halocalculus aciditolerans]
MRYASPIPPRRCRPRRRGRRRRRLHAGNGSSDATLYATTELGTDRPEAVPLNDSRLADSAVVQSVVEEAVADDAAAVDLTAVDAVRRDLDAVRNDTNARTGVYIRHDGTVVDVYVRVET